MTEFVRAYTDDSGNTLVTVSKAFAENAGLHTVKDTPTDVHGRPLPAAEGYRRSKSSGASASEKQETSPGGGNAASSNEEA